MKWRPADKVLPYLVHGSGMDLPLPGSTLLIARARGANPRSRTASR